MSPASGPDPRRLLPSVDQALQTPELRRLALVHGRAAVVRVLREAIAALRVRAAEPEAPGLEPALAALGRDVAERLDHGSRPALRRVINATGVVVHTNLGRAPLSPEAAAHVAEIAASYSNLEYDLVRGERGERESHVEARLRAVVGAEAGVVVNNCAAAVLLAVNTLAEGREVLVSRGELVEIGGSFRIPDILGKGGARLREVGTTNRTRLADYRAALSGETALILKVHPSNFRVVGFTEEAALPELAELAREAGVPLMQDLGSGLVEALPGPLATEATARQALEAGAHVVTFSGDKLLGGPQAGLVAGRRAYLERMRKNPLYRALRVDKMMLAALDATLIEHEAGRARERLPVLRMIATPVAVLAARARALQDALARLAPGLGTSVIEAESVVGGGALPAVGLPTAALAIDPGPGGPERMAAALRATRPPVIARVLEDRLVIDLRTVADDEEEALLAALAEAAGA
jgi:L-seryl-tRNA(Ser) seleniumtransferase